MGLIAAHGRVVLIWGSHHVRANNVVKSEYRVLALCVNKHKYHIMRSRSKGHLCHFNAAALDYSWEQTSAELWHPLVTELRVWPGKLLTHPTTQRNICPCRQCVCMCGTHRLGESAFYQHLCSRSSDTSRLYHAVTHTDQPYLLQYTLSCSCEISWTRGNTLTFHKNHLKSFSLWTFLSF